MNKVFDARRLDVKVFAEEAGQISAADRLATYPRLMAETGGRGADTALKWSAAGELHNPKHLHPEIWLRLQARAILPLTCQRCLAPVDVAVEVERPFRFVADENSAMAEDDSSEVDLLALSRAFDLVELIEDELLMGMPVAPRHEVCPEPVKLAVADEDFEPASAERANPFAILQGIKMGKPR